MQALKFKGNGDEYFKIWIVNILLTIITIGLYAPWAKVRTKRYFYGNTELAGRSFAYHATGKQLFLSYLIAMVLLILFVILDNLNPVLSISLAAIIFLATPWIIYRSARFNARMTSFSNVRFSFAGQIKTAYMIFFLIPLGTISILALVGYLVFANYNIQLSGPLLPSTFACISALVYGFMYLYVEKKGIEYFIGEMKYGQGKFSVSISMLKIFLISLTTALIALGIVLVFFATFISLGIVSLQGDFDSASPESFIALFIFGYLGLIPSVLFLHAYFFSKKRQLIFANTQLSDPQLNGHIQLESEVRTWPYFVLKLTNLLLRMLTCGIAAPWIMARNAKFMAENTKVLISDNEIEAFVTQKTQEQSALGEELGDAFDVGLDIGL